MVDIPKKIKIGGLTFVVKPIIGGYIDKDQEYGAYSLDKLTIFLSEECPLQLKESAFFHEVLEAINDLYDIGLEHSKLCILENVLYQVLKDSKII